MSEYSSYRTNWYKNWGEVSTVATRYPMWELKTPLANLHWSAGRNSFNIYFTFLRIRLKYFWIQKFTSSFLKKKWMFESKHYNSKYSQLWSHVSLRKWVFQPNQSPLSKWTWTLRNWILNRTWVPGQSSIYSIARGSNCSIESRLECRCNTSKHS